MNGEDVFKKRIAMINEIVEGNKNGRINILIAQVDPDAIGAAIGLSYITRSMGSKVAIWYCGSIGHPQNRSIVNRYDLVRVMKPIADYAPEEGDMFALVDSSTIDDSRLGELKGKISPVIVIDHHRSSTAESIGKMIWVEDMGSTCTMVIELINAMELEIPDNLEYIPMLLAMGIYTDTKSLINISDRDLAAYNSISRQVPPQEFGDLVSYPLPETFFHNLQSSLANIVIHGSRLVTNIGMLTTRQADDLSTIADMLIRWDGISLVVVWGVIGNKIRFSARNDDISTPLDDLLKECFGDRSGAKLTPDGQGEGGGLIDLNLGFLQGDDVKEEIIAIIKKRMETLIFGSK
ncbi:MAG: DHH family phosphoesterase [Candidatus Buchananbacteria bacterium]|nr:DHH family phosphoesterase [Candidatus Buchananbacteria bacterium]